MAKIRIECDACHGTGLYEGFCEPEGTAVVCLQCAGTGWLDFQYREFTGRKKRRGVKRICLSRGSFIATGVGEVGEPMTYKEFEKKYPVWEVIEGWKQHC